MRPLPGPGAWRDRLRQLRDSIRGSRIYGAAFRMLQELLSGSSPASAGTAGAATEILVLALYRGIGDFALYSAAHHALRRACGGARISTVVYPSCEEAASLLLPGTRIIRFRGWRRLYRLVKATDFDMVLDVALQKSWAPALFCRLISSRSSAGLYSSFRGVFYRHAFWYDPQRPVASLHLDLLRSLGIGGGEAARPDAGAWGPVPAPVRELQEGREGRPLVVLQPGARDDLHVADKRWPAARFGELARILASQAGALVVVVGDESERALAREVVEAAAGCARDLSGGTDLSGLLHLLDQSSLLVCNNSGLLHLAVLLGVPTVSFAGPVNIAQWGPPGADPRHVVIPNSWGGPAQPGISRRDAAVRQLRAIPAPRVAELVLERLKHARERASLERI